MNDYSTWIILATFILVAPILVYLAAKMWAMGQEMGKARARERLKKERNNANQDDRYMHNHKERKWWS